MGQKPALGGTGKEHLRMRGPVVKGNQRSKAKIRGLNKGVDRGTHQQISSSPYREKRGNKKRRKGRAGENVGKKKQNLETGTKKPSQESAKLRRFTTERKTQGPNAAAQVARDGTMVLGNSELFYRRKGGERTRV